MLLDQKRTKRMVRIVSIFAAVGFVGALIPILVLVIVQGSSGQTTSEQGQDRIQEAIAATKARPNDAAVFDDLARAYLTNSQAQEAITPARRALQLAPRNAEYLSVLVGALTEAGQAEQSVEVAQAFTKRNPRDALGFLQLARVAVAAERTPLALLSYAAVIRLSPNTAEADEAQEAIDQLSAPTETTPTETAPRTTTGPVVTP